MVRTYHGSKRGLEGAIRAGRGNPAEACYWTGYTYRFWNFKTGETSRDIALQGLSRFVVKPDHPH